MNVENECCAREPLRKPAHDEWIGRVRDLDQREGAAQMFQGEDRGCYADERPIFDEVAEARATATRPARPAYDDAVEVFVSGLAALRTSQADDHDICLVGGKRGNLAAKARIVRVVRS